MDPTLEGDRPLGPVDGEHPGRGGTMRRPGGGFGGGQFESWGRVWGWERFGGGEELGLELGRCTHAVDVQSIGTPPADHLGLGGGSGVGGKFGGGGGVILGRTVC